jgi:hypothetical protein
MLQMPPIEMRIRDFGERLHAMMTPHYAQVEQYVHQGVERALARIGEEIIEVAATLATQNIHEDVKHDLLYAEGGQGIRAAVQHALAPLTAKLWAAAGEGGPDDSGMADASVR